MHHSQLASMLALLPLASAACVDDDAPATTSAPLTCDQPVQSTTWRIVSVDLPGDSDAAQEHAFDLDGDLVGGDRSAENKVGGAWSAVVQYLDDAAAQLARSEAQLAARLATDTGWYVTVHACPSSDEVRVAVIGGDALAVDGASAASGVLADGRLIAEGGDGVVPLGAMLDFGDTGRSGWTALRRVMIDASIQPDGTLSGRLGGGLTGDVRSSLVTGLLGWIDDAEGELADAARDVLDDDQDGVLTAQEIAEDDLVVVFTTPDLDLAGADPEVDVYGGDGVPDALSAAVRFRAVPVAGR